MEQREKELIEYEFKRISSIDISLVEDFSCGRTEFDEKLIQMRKQDEGTTYVFFDNIHTKIIGYCTFATSGLRLTYEKDVITQSAAEIKYFAISTIYQHKNYEENMNFSDFMMCELIRHLINIADNHISFNYILLYSVPNAINFYSRNGFYTFQKYMTKDSYTYIDGCIPMYFQL